MVDKVLLGVGGIVGVSITAWRTMFPWLEYDLKMMKAGFGLTKAIQRDVENRYLLIDRFEDRVKAHPNKTFLIFEDNAYSYDFVNQQANRVANIGKSWGLKVDDVVAFYAHNSAEYIWTALGFAKIGVTVSFINCNLHGKTLVHSIKTCGTNILIVGTGIELLNTVLDMESELPELDIYVQGLSKHQIPPNYTSFEDLMQRMLPVPVHTELRSNVNVMSTVCFIYTSGTTGLPKPVYISQSKFITLSKLLTLFGLKHEDIVYLFLPFYHSAAWLCITGIIEIGGTIVIRKKFSATHFWQDVCRYNVTSFQYIGELCRYLLNQKPDPLETQHKIRVMYGNGLRKDIWAKFQHRFRIPLVSEFFGATEGHGFTFQISNKPGAIGRLSPLLKFFDTYPKTLIKCDPHTAEPIRDENGRCIEIKPGENGLFITMMPTELVNVPLYRASEEANKKKIIRNAFTEGDAYFNFGDLFYLDHDYFLYFKDRTGDTFRWKGENVSTTEVANTLTSLPFIHDANVYGVTVPGHDGRAGMAALTLTENAHDLSDDHLGAMYKYCDEELPRYAQPLFLRILQEPDMTATFKHRKVDLMKEGFDPTVTTDRLYFRDDGLKKYVPITFEFFTEGIAKSKL